MADRIAYSIDQSPIYRLISKKCLAKLLDFRPQDFNTLIADLSYYVFKNRQGRIIQHPLGKLARVHRRLAKYLTRLKLPEYLHSRKTRSYVTNAAAHQADVPLIKMDITQFYPSTSFSAIYSLFTVTFKCSPDVAWSLARFICYKGNHLPTGSYLSGIVAFLAHRNIFDEIHSLAVKHGCTMTLYVDDIVVSGPRATKSFLYEIRKIVRQYGVTTKDEKSRTFPRGKPKTVTGVVISTKGLRVPNKRLRAIHLAKRQLKRTDDPQEKRELMSTLQGRAQEAKQIDRANQRGQKV